MTVKTGNRNDCCGTNWNQIAAVFGFSSEALTGVCKKLDPKIYKHRDIVSLSIAKRESVNRLVSKALTDQKIEDSEFQLVLDEMSRFNALKAEAHHKQRRESSRKTEQS